MLHVMESFGASSIDQDALTCVHRPPSNDGTNAFDTSSADVKIQAEVA